MNSDFKIYCPVDSGIITGNFGEKKHPFKDISVFNSGISIATPPGRKVYSVQDRFISYLGDNKTYGLTIHVNHDSSFTTTYSHLGRILIDKGKKVKKGDIIGLVGDTGLLVAPHLHFELLKNGKPVNPMIYLDCAKIKIGTDLRD